jgi:hypothetical protein
MRAVIFLGPSLPTAAARQALDAIYLPPAQQGDILSAISRYEPDVIGLIDGEFFQSLAVWHKELLYALERGIHVFGASSMGALRAAETDVYGTVGVGEVYRMFAREELTDDDEVALAHGAAEDGYRPLSEALVNIRVTLRRAVDEGVIDAPLAARLVDAEKAVFFPERSYQHLFDAAAAAGEDAVALERLRAFVRSSRVDQKRLDALALLTRVRELPDPLPRFVPAFQLESTRNFRGLYDQDRKVPVDGTDLPLSAIQNHAALHAADYLSLNGHALDRALLQILADLLEIPVTAADVAAERRRFCVERRIASEESLTEWWRAHHLSAEEFETLVAQLARRRALHRWFIHRLGSVGITRVVLDELRIRGDYLPWARRALEHERLLGDDAVDDLGVAERVADDRLSDAELATDHMRATVCRVPIGFVKWSDEVGIGAGRLRVDLLRAREARRRASREIGELLGDALLGDAVG